MSDRLIGRDQVWFTEKRNDGSSRLYPLSDLDPRKEEAISKRGPGLGYSVDAVKCTGCGTCFEQCPCHAIEMVSTA